MKNINISYLLNILLAIALIILAVKVAFLSNGGTPNSESADTEASQENVAIQNIMTRTSVRTYSDREVTNEQIDTLIRAAMAAPTAVNKQPWQFVVIKERATLDSIAANFKNIQMASGAQIAIVVCGDLSLALEGDGQAYWIQDTSAATENLLLAAHAMGLGAVWCGIYPIADRVQKVKGMLNLPDNIIPLNIIPIGYPAAPSTPKDKYDADKIHIDSF